MTQDLLSPYRTAGTAPSQPGEPEKHRSVADGELANPWTLKEFFNSLNSVMRLPSKARRKAEPASGGATTFALPGIRPWMSKAVVAGGVVAVVSLVVVRPLVLWASKAGHASLAPVVGVWEAGKGKYQGRRFEVSDSAVAFQKGESADDYSWHRIQEVQVKTVADSALYTIRYEEGNKTADLSFWYRTRPAPVIRLKNSLGVAWNRTGLAPRAAPPAQQPPRL
jgi:hypothetical protein